MTGGGAGRCWADQHSDSVNRGMLRGGVLDDAPIRLDFHAVLFPINLCFRSGFSSTWAQHGMLTHTYFYCVFEGCHPFVNF